MQWHPGQVLAHDHRLTGYSVFEAEHGGWMIALPEGQCRGAIPPWDEEGAKTAALKMAQEKE